MITLFSIVNNSHTWKNNTRPSAAEIGGSETISMQISISMVYLWGTPKPRNLTALNLNATVLYTRIGKGRHNSRPIDDHYHTTQRCGVLIRFEGVLAVCETRSGQDLPQLFILLAGKRLSLLSSLLDGLVRKQKRPLRGKSQPSVRGRF